MPSVPGSVAPPSQNANQDPDVNPAVAATPEKATDETPLAPPQLHVNGKPTDAEHGVSQGLPTSSSGSVAPPGADGAGWGANFWVTLADPQTNVSFYACPATGEVSWDPPVGNFVLPLSPEGEWWEMLDEASGLPYYYQTKTGATVWEKPEAFVIPLRVLQNTALTRRLSLNDRNSLILSNGNSPTSSSKPGYRRSRSFAHDGDADRSSVFQSGDSQHRRRSQSTTRASPAHSSNNSPHPSPSSSKPPKHILRRSASGERHNQPPVSPLAYERGHPLAPIPGSPYNTDASPPPSPTKRSISHAFVSSKDQDKGKSPARESPKRKVSGQDDSLARSRSSHSPKSAQFMPYRSPQPQSLSAALEKIALSTSQSPSPSSPAQPQAPSKKAPQEERNGRKSISLGRASGLGYSRPRLSTDPASLASVRGASTPTSPTKDRNKENSLRTPTSPTRTLSPTLPAPDMGQKLVGKDISAPVFNMEATMNMSPVKMRSAGKPIIVQRSSRDRSTFGRPSMADSQGMDQEFGMFFPKQRTATLNTGTYPVLPDDLASDIQQFSESQYARQYFSTHRTGFIFRRRIPVEEMMTWQKSPLNAPLLQLSKPFHKESIKTFKSIQRIMGDRDRDRDRPSPTGSTTSLVASSVVLEEERSLLSEGLSHGEMRDEIYCQVMKQLTGNPNTESVFKGWQLLCVLLVTFPPSKNFEPSLRSFINQATHQSQGRIDIMAKYCLRRLEYVSRKGPRGKAPTLSEIETASDAAFHPSIFGESLDAIFRLQERNYPHQKVPITLPFLADGILALGGTKSEGIFRVPGDGDLVSELKLRIDKGYYTLDGLDDPHVLASLFKLWLRELADPLIPDEMYNDCTMQSNDPAACVQIVHRLPTINRRVVLFVVSFLQLFLEEKVQAITKMTAPNLALVMAPNLLRCSSESMAVVFTNAQYEQAFVHNLLLHLKCDEIDKEYIPAHGLGAIPPPPPPIPLAKTKSNTKGRRRSDS